MNAETLDQLDLVSVKIAQELADLGFKWSDPRPGDWAVFRSHKDPRLVLGSAIVPQIPGALQVCLQDGDRGEWWLREELIWLPRRCDCERKLGEMGYDHQQTYHGPTFSHFTAVRGMEGLLEEQETVQAQAAAPADAVGLVLIEALRKEQDEPTRD